MKRLLLIIISAIAIQTAAGQDNRYYSTFQVGFVPPLSTNGREAPRYTNAVSLNLLAGISQNELGFSLNGLTSIVRHNADGVHLSGIYNFVGNEGKGALFSGIGNNVLGSYAGTLWGGIFNTSRNMTGAQFGGIFNLSHALDGAQFAGIMNVAHDTEGVQAGGIANKAGNLRGVQLGGIVDIAKNTEGVQLAGIVNTARDMNGVQCAGIANIGGSISGIQAAGIFNTSRDMHGVQAAAIFNLARDVDGLQIGLVNIARDNDYPIGLLNIIRNGELTPGIGFDEMANLSVMFRSGGRVFYGILGAGINLRDRNKYVVEGGIGAHINCASWFRINNELKSSSLSDFSEEALFTAGYSLLPTFRIGKRVELYAGPSFNYCNGREADLRKLLPYKTLYERTTGERTSALYIGYTAGIQIALYR